MATSGRKTTTARTAAGAAKTGSLAAGAARASGERARRRTTPLLAIDPIEPADAVGSAPTTSAPTASAPTASASAGSASTGSASTGSAAAKAESASAGRASAAARGADGDAAQAVQAASGEPAARRRHRPRPAVTSGVARKAVAQAGERRPAPRASATRTARSPKAAPAPAPRTSGAGKGASGPATPASERSVRAGASAPGAAASTGSGAKAPAGRRPRRADLARTASSAASGAAGGAAGATSGTSQRGPSAPSANDKRAADERAARRLRVAEPPRPRLLEALPDAATPAGSDVTTTSIPGVEEIITSAVSALRLAAANAGLAPDDIERHIARLLAFVRRRIEGDYTVDEFGYDEDFTEHVVLPLLRPLYNQWFRVEVRGIENIPADGPALIVANHSGTIAIDSLMVSVAIHDEHPQQRVMRSLGADLVFDLPFVGALARKGGSTLATNADADRLFRRGELVGVFPEGFKGIGKPFKERYKLQRFGRGGFVSAALRAGAPIIPTSVVGAEEIMPIIGNLGPLARLFGLPYLPITPTWPLLGPLGLVPLPSKWIIEFGAPIDTAGFGPKAADDPMLVFDLTDQVRETIQQTLYALLMRRRSVFF